MGPTGKPEVQSEQGVYPPLRLLTGPLLFSPEDDPHTAVEIDEKSSSFRRKEYEETIVKLADGACDGAGHVPGQRHGKQRQRFSSCDSRKHNAEC